MKPIKRNGVLKFHLSTLLAISLLSSLFLWENLSDYRETTSQDRLQELQPSRQNSFAHLGWPVIFFCACRQNGCKFCQYSWPGLGIDIALYTEVISFAFFFIERTQGRDCATKSRTD